MNRIVYALVLIATTSTAAFAQVKERIESESRDAAVGFIGNTNFVVGRIGRDCLSVVGRSETPQQLVEAWQQRNLKYLVAVERYMGLRLEEAFADGGEKKRDEVMKAATQGAQELGAATVRSWLESGDKLAACKRALSLVDSGALDVHPRMPLYSELEALREWADRH